MLLLSLVVPLLAAGVIAGCGSDDGDSSSTGGGETTSSTASGDAPISKMSIITPEKATDYGFNQQGVEDAQDVADELGIELEVAEEAGYEDITPILLEFTGAGSEFIIAHAGGYNTIAPEIAEQTGVPVLVGDNAEAMKPGLVASWTAAIEQGAYLAGVLAAQTTQDGKLGIVMSADSTFWNRQAGGFVVGARSVDPGIEITLAQISQAGFADVAGGKRVTKAVIADGADIIFGMGDGSSFGMIKAVEEAEGVSFIDVIGDKTPIDKQNVLLSSVLWNFDGLYKEALSDLGNGTYGDHGYELDVENGGISLLHTDQIDAATWKEIEGIEEEIVAGEIKVPVTEEKPQVEDLIAKG